MKYRVQVGIQGGGGRPYYEGGVTVYSDEPEPDFQWLVHQRLKMTTFQDGLLLDDVIVKSVVVQVQEHKRF